MKRLLFLNKLKSKFSLKRFLKDPSAVAMVEFALILPLLMMLTVGSFEVGRYALLMQKLDRITATLADLVARSEALSSDEIDNLFNATNHLAAPFDFDTDGMVVITSIVGREGEEPIIIGQKVKGALGSYESQVGVLDGEASLPAVFTDADGQTLEDEEALIVTEVFYSFTPYMTSDIAGLGSTILAGSLIYRDAFFRPRLSERT
ncbi:MAG: TadE/TadG family type IV pilus assembly protein, partial [Sneathiella sp.]